MKKNISLLLMIMLLVSLSGCFKNKVVPNEGEIHLYLDAPFQEVMPYQNVPSYLFTFDGILNTIEHVPNTHYTIFASNDDFFLSDRIKDLFTTYENDIAFEVASTERQHTTRMNERDEDNAIIVHNLMVDDEIVYYETAFIALENGLKLTLDYRRFESEGITYYSWRYTSNISMFLYFPLMVVATEDSKELLLLTLPNRIKFQVGPQLRLSHVLSKNEYLEDSKYSFFYLEEHETVEDKKAYVRTYYTEHFETEEVGDLLHFVYLDVVFSIEFYDNVFTIRFVEKRF